MTAGSCSFIKTARSCNGRSWEKLDGSPAALPYPNLDPVIVGLGPIQLRWYGLMYLIGLTTAYFLIQRKVTRKELAIRRDQVYDMVVYAAFGVFLGDGSAIRSSITFHTTAKTPETSRSLGRRNVLSRRAPGHDHRPDLV